MMLHCLIAFALAGAAVDTGQQEVVKSQPKVVATTNQIPTVQIPFENIGIFDPLPGYTKQMSDTMFRKWAQAQNAMAYRKAQQRADEWLVRNPALDTYVQDNDYDSTSTLKQNEKANSAGATVDASSGTSYTGHSVQRTFRDRNRWGGGPVVIINPYVRPE